MIINTTGVNSATLLAAMKAAILACRTQGWNFHGRRAKANELQGLCDAYEIKANTQLVEQFISLAIRPRPFISFTLFGHKFEFGKATYGNTNSAIAFNGVLTAAADNVVEQPVSSSDDDAGLPSQEESDDENSYMAIQKLINDPSKPSETTLKLPLISMNNLTADYNHDMAIEHLMNDFNIPSEATLELPLTPTNDQVSDYSRELSDIIAKLNGTKTGYEAGPLMEKYSIFIKKVSEREKATFEKSYVDMLIEKEHVWFGAEEALTAMDDGAQNCLNSQQS